MELFISMWDYYTFSNSFKMDLETFATNTSNAFKKRTDRMIKKKEGHNMMLADFGLSGGCFIKIPFRGRGQLSPSWKIFSLFMKQQMWEDGPFGERVNSALRERDFTLS